jgi:urease accessory protein
MPLLIDEVLLALQLADSGFPSGAFTFSWGLEGLAADGLIESKQDVLEIVEEQVTFRWACLDRVFLAEAHATIDELSMLEIDRRADASIPMAPLRIGSRRAGRRLLGIFAEMGFARAKAYRELIGRTADLGHLPVVQGLVFREAGLGLEAATLVSGWTTVSGLVSAAVRLGLVGHRDAQSILTGQRATLARTVSMPLPAGAKPWSFTPLLDIAIARNAGRTGRMFAT